MDVKEEDGDHAPTSNDHMTNRSRFYCRSRTAVADRVDIYGAGLHGFAQPHAAHHFGSARFEGNPAYASRECTWWCWDNEHVARLPAQHASEKSRGWGGSGLDVRCPDQFELTPTRRLNIFLRTKLRQSVQ
jgi:hypothetical protein